jgi:hypothetical protein
MDIQMRLIDTNRRSVRYYFFCPYPAYHKDNKIDMNKVSKTKILSIASKYKHVQLTNIF